MRPVALLTLVVSTVLLATAAVQAATVDFNLSYSDPASDVVKLYSSNMTAVRTSAGDLVMSPFPDAVNILRLNSADAGLNVSVSMELKGDVADLPNTTYEFRLYTRSDNASHSIVTYTNGYTTLDSNATGSQPQNITGNSTISAVGTNPTLLNELTIRLAKALLGNITYWNLDASATQTGSPYSYRDFGWEVPGSPGSAPPTPTPSGFLSNWWWLLLAIGVIAAAVLVAVLVARRRRKGPRASKR